MAKLGSYYGLCPLIDQKSLLGICADETPGCIVVTLGKNMAIIYRISDQKQLRSWSTKEKLSSPVIYDATSKKYVAIFNQQFVRQWSASDVNLDKIKKIKFPTALHTILACESEPIVVFKSGHACTLSRAAEMRKAPSQTTVIGDGDVLLEANAFVVPSGAVRVGLMLKTGRSSHAFLWAEPDENVFHRVELKRHVKLLGHLVARHDGEPHLFTLWSDGRLYSYALSRPEKTESPGVLFSIIETLSRKSSVSMVSIADNYIAMYGADSNQEGASLQIYNAQFKVTQARQPFKMYAEGSKLWLANDALLLTVGQNLAVVPFRLDAEQLAALVGSHQLTACTDDQDIVVVTQVQIGDWESPSDEAPDPDPPDALPPGLRSQLADLIREGWSESAVCREIFPKLAEGGHTAAILACLDRFRDIPESVLADLLAYSGSRGTLAEDDRIATRGLPDGRARLVDKLLTVSCSPVVLVPLLRAKLDFDWVVALLQHLCFLLGENGRLLPSLDGARTDAAIVAWGSMLLDSHYQQLLLSRDPNVLDTLRLFKTLADDAMRCIHDYKKAEPVLAMLERGKPGRTNGPTSTKYSIETLKLY